MTSYIILKSKKFLLLVLSLLMLISVLFISVPTAHAAGPYDIVKVKISIGTPTTLPVFIDGNFSIEEDPSVVLERQLYTVQIDGSNLKLFYGGILKYTGATLTLLEHTATEGRNNFVWLENTEHSYRRYIGKLAFSIVGSAIQLINHLYMEDYIFGVVPYEMSNSWPVEALKAQAICARTYVCNYIGGGAFDVVDTTDNQVYKGYNAEYTNALAAVTGTAKKVLKLGEDFVPTYYSASNGGYTEIPQHIWSASNPIMPYHVIQEDPFDAANPRSEQEVLIFPKTITDTDVIKYQYQDGGSMVTGTGSESANAERYFKICALSAVAAKGYIASVSDDIKIVGVNNVTAHTFDPDDHHDILDHNDENKCVDFIKANVNMTVKAKRYDENAVLMLGDVNGDGSINIFDYTLVRLDILGLKALAGNRKTAADVNKDGIINIFDYTLIRLDILDLKKIVQNGEPSELLVEEEVTVDFEIDMREFEDSDGIYRAFNNFSLRLFVVENTAGSCNIYQRRYGHGIGMSQRGAQQRANSTDPAVNTYDKIIQFYYPNTALEALAIEKAALTAVPYTPAAENFNATINCTNSVNVRSDPSTANPRIGTLPSCARVLVTQANVIPGWHKISYAGGDGYMSSDYVTLDPPS